MFSYLVLTNGKSKLIELFKMAFGDYAGNLPVALLTQKRAASGAANPELARCRGKRFVDMAEPDRGNRMNIGFMKELTGGDKILVRQLYKEPFEFKPMFKIVLCCNDLPKVPPDDEGTWRRLRVVKFISKFTTNPKKENEYPIDPYLADNFERWKEPFMYILLQYYEIYKNEGIKEPSEVLQATKDYQKMADVYVDFLDDMIVKGEEADIVSLDDLYNKYKPWYIHNYGSAGLHNQKVFASNMERKIGKFNAHNGWKYMKIRLLSDPITNPDGDAAEKLDYDNLPGVDRMAIDDQIKDDEEDEEITKPIIIRNNNPLVITHNSSNKAIRMRKSSRSISRRSSREHEITETGEVGNHDLLLPIPGEEVYGGHEEGSGNEETGEDIEKEEENQVQKVSKLKLKPRN
jgi:P4 family phage/plasmid primase-like protien